MTHPKDQPAVAALFMLTALFEKLVEKQALSHEELNVTLQTAREWCQTKGFNVSAQLIDGMVEPLKEDPDNLPKGPAISRDAIRQTIAAQIVSLVDDYFNELCPQGVLTEEFDFEMDEIKTLASRVANPETMI